MESATELSARWDTLHYSFQKCDITARRDGLDCHEIGEGQMVIQLHRTTRATPRKVRDETSQTKSRRFEKGKNRAGEGGRTVVARQTDTLESRLTRSSVILSSQVQSDPPQSNPIQLRPINSDGVRYHKMKPTVGVVSSSAVKCYRSGIHGAVTSHPFHQKHHAPVHAPPLLFTSAFISACKYDSSTLLLR